jgi:hypothetical protein
VRLLKSPRKFQRKRINVYKKKLKYQPSRAICFLISAMARPGLRPFGHVRVQSYDRYI